jgi:hypothetical protein
MKHLIIVYIRQQWFNQSDDIFPIKLFKKYNIFLIILLINVDDVGYYNAILSITLFGLAFNFCIVNPPKN